MADTQTFQVTNKKQFLALLKDADLKKDKVQSISGELGERIKAASDNGHLNRGAFGLMLKLYRMEEGKRGEFLRNFDAYRAYADEEQLFGSEHVGDLDDMAKRSAADDQAEAEERFDAEEAQVAANTEALEKGIKRLPTPAELADAFEAGRIAFFDNKGGVIPDGMSAKLGEEYLRGWASIQALSVEERLALKSGREPDAEFDDATASKPSRRGRKAAGVGEGGDAAGTYQLN